MTGQQRIPRTAGSPADMSPFHGAATCNVVVNGSLVGTRTLIVGYAWWDQTPQPLLHRHDTDEVVYVVSGECVHLGEGDHVRAKAGDFVYAPAGRWHGVYNASPDVQVELVVIFGGTGELADVGFEVCPPDLAEQYLHNLSDFLDPKPGG